MVKSLFVCVFVLCFFALGSCMKVPFKNCGPESDEAKLGYVDIEPCVGGPKNPCELKRGSVEIVQVQFTPHVNITGAKTVVHGIIPYVPVPVPFPVDQPDACKDHGVACPMSAGKTYTFKTHLPIKSEYPKLELTVKWQMEDVKSGEVYCWEVAASIVD